MEASEEEVRRLVYLDAVSSRLVGSSGENGAILSKLGRKVEALRRKTGAEQTPSGPIAVQAGSKKIDDCVVGLERCWACQQPLVAGITLEVRFKRGRGVVWTCRACHHSFGSMPPRVERQKSAASSAGSVSKPKRKKAAGGLKELLSAKRHALEKAKNANGQNPALDHFLFQ